MNRFVIAALVVSGVAHADIFSERVVLEVSPTKLCPNHAGYEVRLMPLNADGIYRGTPDTPYVIPAGYVLEVTDLTWTPGWYWDAIAREVYVNAQNRITGTHAQLWRQQVGPWAVKRSDFSSPYDGTTGYVLPRDTRHVTFASGLLFSDQARVCVDFLFDNSFLDPGLREVRFRGRLHWVGSTAQVPEPPPPGTVK